MCTYFADMKLALVQKVHIFHLKGHKCKSEHRNGHGKSRDVHGKVMGNIFVKPLGTQMLY